MIKVAILGKPNVGKSSLFNRLLRERDAIVSEKAGTTRDIKKREISLDDELEDILLIDTGGLEERDELSFEELLKMLDVDEVVLREVLTQMREDGDIFEPRPGVYKLL